MNEGSLARARAYLQRMPEQQRAQAENHWSGTTDWDRFDRADVVIEAVFEILEQKLEVFRELGSRVAPDALLASNTSAISIDTLAQGIASPRRFLGMHFFSPVERMPLVELIPHRGTSLDTIDRARAFARQLGKTPIIVGDAPGFFTSRVYARWLIEGVRLLLDGYGADQVDAAARSVGFPVGPLAAIDEASTELVLQASLGQVGEKIMSERVDVGTVSAVLRSALESGARGRRFGCGFYSYSEEGRRIGVNRRAVPARPPVRGAADTALPSERLLLAFVTECLLCWDDGTLCHPDDGDLGAVLGIGFPRQLGGPFHWIDQQGATAVLRRIEALGNAGFPAGTSLPQLASEGQRFSAQTRRPAPFTSTS
jgi:3-hydroxyacyl-CoA dehydrogenase/enoyl-CoA hydratase/3-hydroxybutyryl-CoA epimerase